MAKPYVLIDRMKYCLLVICYFLWFISVPHSVPRSCVPAFTVTPWKLLIKALWSKPLLRILL